MYSPPPTLACRILQSVWVSNLAMTKRCSHSHFLPRQPFLQDDARTGGLTGGTCSSDDKRAKMGMGKWGARTGHTSSFTCRVAETGKTIHFSALPFAMHPIILVLFFIRFPIPDQLFFVVGPTHHFLMLEHFYHLPPHSRQGTLQQVPEVVLKT